jgi:hypothetical protein
MNHQLFIQEVENALDLSSLSKEVRELVIKNLGENILQRTLLSIAQTLTEEDAKIVSAKLQDGKLDEVIQFLDEHHPLLNEKVVTISREVIDEFLQAQKGDK